MEEIIAKGGGALIRSTIGVLIEKHEREAKQRFDELYTNNPDWALDHQERELAAFEANQQKEIAKRYKELKKSKMCTHCNLLLPKNDRKCATCDRRTTKVTTSVADAVIVSEYPHVDWEG